MQVQGWSIGDGRLFFDFGLLPADSIQRAILITPELTRIQLSIDTALYGEDQASLLNGRRRFFQEKQKK